MKDKPDLVLTDFVVTVFGPLEKQRSTCFRASCHGSESHIPLGLTMNEAARRLGVNRKTLSARVNCKVALSPEMAIRIGKATRTTPENWLSMRAKLDLGRAAGKSAQGELFEGS